MGVPLDELEYPDQPAPEAGQKPSPQPEAGAGDLKEFEKHLSQEAREKLRRSEEEKNVQVAKKALELAERDELARVRQKIAEAEGRGQHIDEAVRAELEAAAKVAGQEKAGFESPGDYWQTAEAHARREKMVEQSAKLEQKTDKRELELIYLEQGLPGKGEENPDKLAAVQELAQAIATNAEHPSEQQAHRAMNIANRLERQAYLTGAQRFERAVKRGSGQVVGRAGQALDRVWNWQPGWGFKGFLWKAFLVYGTLAFPGAALIAGAAIGGLRLGGAAIENVPRLAIGAVEGVNDRIKTRNVRKKYLQRFQQNQASEQSRVHEYVNGLSDKEVKRRLKEERARRQAAQQQAAGQSTQQAA